MTLLRRSLLALFVTSTLAACDTDSESTVPFKPEPLQPDNPIVQDYEVGDSIIKATKESLVITDLEGNEKLAWVDSFKGITYADPVRFEHSTPLELDEYVRAINFGSACPQLKATSQPQKEDCLNLNIWRPADTTQGDDLPVYVFIHGGDFEYGAGSEPLIHGDMVAAQSGDSDEPVIVVTFNYRLGLLGTRFVNSTKKNGNYGLGDQKTALKWVQDNIAKFGGNPGNVTVMGQGAGAMSVGILQHQMTNEDLDSSYFQRAIMQSNPLGFEYASFTARKARFEELELDKLPLEGDLDVILDKQRQILSPVSKIENWVLRNIGGAGKALFPDLFSGKANVEQATVDLELGDIIDYLSRKLNYMLSADKTGMAEFMPFAPYMECDALLPDLCGFTSVQQPATTDFAVPTVIGSNKKDSNTFAMTPSLTFLIPTILKVILDAEPELANNNDPEAWAVAMAKVFADDMLRAQLESEMNQLMASPERLEAIVNEENAGLSLSAYEAVTQLFFGLGNLETNSELLSLTDYYRNDETDLGGAIANMGQFRTILNDMLFTGPAHQKVRNSAQQATLYRFDYSPWTNVWTYNTKGQERDLDVGDLLKTISCISGACNGSELPFVFNKAYKLDGTESFPGSNDRALMNKMSRVWFSQELFDGYRYEQASDDALVIDSDGNMQMQSDWDLNHNPGIDPQLRDGRLHGLNDLELLLHYMDSNS
ncbi:carboxylesterase family protein [Vibrio ishigakensis]|nr:carboxylesterase family protein [Vibrio ishigakensis]